jgi:hypothetical protein
MAAAPARDVVFLRVGDLAGGWAVMARIVDNNGDPIYGIDRQAKKPGDFR